MDPSLLNPALYLFKYSSVLSALQDALKGISKDIFISVFIFKEHLTS